jgi:hypothetical protein
MEDDPPATAEIGAPLDGTLQTLNCTPARAGKLASAIQLIDDRIWTDVTTDCFASAYFAYERHDILAEDLVAALGARAPVIECVAPGHCGANAIACAGVPPFGSPAPERMAIETDFLDSGLVLDLASVITHEATHSLGYHHPGSSSSLGYLWSVPVQAANCIRNQSPDGLSRAGTYGDNETAPVGGGGGLPFLVRCPAGQRVTGITADTSSHINRLRLLCDGAPIEAVGSFNDSTRSETHACAAGSSLAGSLTWSDSMVRLMLTQCVADVDLTTSNPSPAKQWSLLGGSGVGTVAERTCPVGMAVVGAIGRAGARIDQLRWICGDRDGAILPNPTLNGQRGTPAGVGKYEHCSGFGALRGLYGHAAQEVTRLAAECMATHRPGGVLAMNASKRHGLEPHGGSEGLPFEKPCPAGMAMIGVQARAGGRLDAIGAICADPAAWAAGLTTSLHFTGMAGGGGGFASELRCPIRSFVTGLRSWAKPTPELGGITSIHGIEPYCRRLE